MTQFPANEYSEEVQRAIQTIRDAGYYVSVKRRTAPRVRPLPCTCGRHYPAEIRDMGRVTGLRCLRCDISVSGDGRSDSVSAWNCLIRFQEKNHIEVHFHRLDEILRVIDETCQSTLAGRSDVSISGVLYSAFRARLTEQVISQNGHYGHSTQYARKRGYSLRSEILVSHSIGRVITEISSRGVSDSFDYVTHRASDDDIRAMKMIGSGILDGVSRLESLPWPEKR